MRSTQEMYYHICRLWPHVMAGECITYDIFVGESFAEQSKFYNWICSQFGELADLV